MKKDFFIWILIFFFFFLIEIFIVFVFSKNIYFLIIPSLLLFLIILLYNGKKVFEIIKEVKIKNILYIILGTISIFMILFLQNLLYVKKSNLNKIVKFPPEFYTYKENLKDEKILMIDEKSPKGEITSGPYLHLPDGHYNIILYYNSSSDIDSNFKILIKGGRLPLNFGKIKANEKIQKISFTVINGNGADIEFKIYYNGKGKLEIFKYEIIPDKINLFFFLNFLKNIFNSISLSIISIIFILFLKSRSELHLSELVVKFNRIFSILLLLWLPLFFSIFNLLNEKNNFILVFVILTAFLTIFFVEIFIILYYDKIKIFPEKRSAFLKEIKYILSILAIGFLLRVPGITNGLPEINLHPDEMDLVERALRFFVNFKINTTPFFHLATYSYLQSILYAFFTIVGMLSGKIFSFGHWLINPHEALLISRFFSVIFSIMSIFVLIKIGFIIGKKNIGYLAGLFMSVCYMDVWMSHIAKSNTLIIFSILSSVYFTLNVYLKGDKKYYLLASIFIGLASAIKLNNLILVLPFLFAHFFSNREDKVKLIEILFDKKIILAGILVIFFMFVFNPLLVWKTKEVINNFLTEAKIGGKSYPNIFLKFIDGWKFHFFYSLFFGSGMTLFVIGILGLKSLFKLNKIKFLILMSYPIIFFILLGNVSRHYPRYADVIIPFILLSGATLCIFIFDKIKNNFQRYIITLLLILPNLIYDIDLNILYSRKNNSLIVRDFILKNLPENATIAHLGDSSYSKITKIKNKVINISEDNFSDYLIVYYNNTLSEREENIIRFNYDLIKYFKVDKSGKKRSIPSEGSPQLKSISFERFRCDIGLFQKKNLIK